MEQDYTNPAMVIAWLFAFMICCFQCQLTQAKDVDTRQTHWFNQIVRFLSRNNDVHIDNLVLGDHPDECKDSYLCKDLWKVLFEEHISTWNNDSYVPFLKLVNFKIEIISFDLKIQITFF